MKFTEEEAYKEIVAKLTNNGKSPLQASERTMKALLKKYYSKFASEETELQSFIDENIEDFKEVDGNVNYDKATFVKEYQKANPPKKEEETKDTKAKDDKGSELKSLLDRLEKLENERKAEIAKATIGNKKSMLADKMKELGIKNEKWSNAMISKMNITEETDIEKEANEFLELYNDFSSDINPNAVPDSTNGKGSKDYDFSNIAADLVAERKRQQGE